MPLFRYYYPPPHKSPADSPKSGSLIRYCRLRLAAAAAQNNGVARTLDLPLFIARRVLIRRRWGGLVLERPWAFLAIVFVKEG